MKTVLITGTTQGIGKEIYTKLNNGKFRIITVNRKKVLDESSMNIICDLSEIKEICSLCDKLKNEKIDILINNAGGSCPIQIEKMSVNELMYVTNLNYYAPVLIMQSVIGNMIAQNYGRILNISSIASKSPRPYISHYAAAKAALESFSKSMAVAYSGFGVTVNCICPGGVDTKTSVDYRRLMAQIADKPVEYFNDQMKCGNGLNRLVRVEEVAAMVEYFISDEASAISGQTVNICGIKEVH